MKDIARWVVFAGIFAVPFIPLIIANSLFFPFITGKNFSFRVIVEIITAGWIILAFCDAKYRPKFSWIVGGFIALLGVMFFADLFGEYPLKSFWSNYERMEGYVTLVHVFLYLIVVGSVITTEKLWNRLFNTTLIAALILALYAFAQLSGDIVINQGGWRLDGTLGNSAYMAVYTLFHIFIAALLLVRTQSRGMRYLYIAFIALYVFLLIQTATRGTTLGLIGGSFITVAYIAIFSRGYPKIQKFATGGILAIVVLVGLFITFKESAVVQENPYLQRLASITLDEGSVRFKIWEMAYEGFKERPVLGWGQGNFSYIFNAKYNPELYSAEQWYDRVHNIVFDWLVAGGVLGFLAYFSILIAALYYILFLPLVRKDETFTVMERGVLLGLLAGYVFHNLFVFDNIVSYIYYGTILAFIHSRVSREISQIQSAQFDQRVTEQIVVPIVGVAVLAVVYFVNVPGYLAAGDIIDAFSTQDPNAILVEFDQALSRDSFADQEIREQLTQRGMAIIRTQQIPQELKDRAFSRIEEELLKEIEEKPGDARVHVFISSFYRSTGNVDKALEQLEIARALSPKKQTIIFEQGLAKLQQGKYNEALSYFRDAYELEHSYDIARKYYAAAALYSGKPEIVDEVIDTEGLRKMFANDDLAMQAAYAAQDYVLLDDMFNRRIAAHPDDPQFRVNLAVIKNESGDTAGAIEVLTQAGEDIPSFKAQADGFIADLKAGRKPGSQPSVKVGDTEVDSTSIELPVSQ